MGLTILRAMDADMSTAKVGSRRSTLYINSSKKHFDAHTRPWPARIPPIQASRQTPALCFLHLRCDVLATIATLMLPRTPDCPNAMPYVVHFSPGASSMSSPSSSTTLFMILLSNRSRTNRRTGSRKAWLSRTRITLRNRGTELNSSGDLDFMLH